MGIKVVKGGLLTTIQDCGRTGFRKDGIIVSGAMDTLALTIGNLLLRNNVQEAGLECTVIGPVLVFETAQLIALTGGDLSPEVDGEPVQMWRPLFVRRGATLRFGPAVKGCRTYITVFGGFHIPKVLGSYATYLKAGFGGQEGRALKQGDIIGFNKTCLLSPFQHNWFVEPSVYVDLNDHTIRVLPGPEYDLFSEESKLHLQHGTYLISKAADRMGYRLDGPTLKLTRQKEMLSSAVTFGTVQVPPNGAPIILMADHQTTGGYPRALQVITADFSKLAQMQSGVPLRFKLVTLETAQAALHARAKDLRQLKLAIELKYECYD